MFVLGQHLRWVVDEAQRMPELFATLRYWLDENPRRRIVLLGSASPSLVKRIGESLTGRVGIYELPGLSIEEARGDALWLQGSFPRVHWGRPRARPQDWYPSYLRTTLEQDLPQLGVRSTYRKLHDFLTMLAHGQGGLSNYAEWASSLGVDYHTVSHWLDVLEGVFLVRRLTPWHANIGKRLVKSPKIYVRDTGLLHSLLGTGFSFQQLAAHPKGGASFETFCIEQLIAHARLVDSSATAHFFRTHTRVEADLVLTVNGKTVALEIKLGTAVPDVSHLEICMKDLGLRSGYVVSRVSELRAVTPTIQMGSLADVIADLGLGA
jgi:predicted AAA+ superfamily ATPase